jgi:hypothetical protein
VDGDTAAAQSYVLVVSAGKPLTVTLAGRYEDRIVRHGGRWRFRTRAVHFDLMAQA